MTRSTDGKGGREFLDIPDFQQYVQSDVAGTFSQTQSDAARAVDSKLVDAQRKQLLQDGFVILKDIVTQEQLDRLREQAAPFLVKAGRNSFEGERTQRIYGLPEKVRAADPFIEHPLILAHLDRLLMPNYLLSQAQVINIQSDSPAQPEHVDDGFYPWPRPRPAISIATVFAIDDFTAENGATVAIPGSHRWDDQRTPRDSDERVQAVMTAGSCILFMGNLWHGGGANASGGDRLALTCQYCEPWARTQENYFLSVSKETAASVSEDIRRMLGYSIHPPFMGMVDGMHPKRKLPGFDQTR